MILIVGVGSCKFFLDSVEILLWFWGSKLGKYCVNKVGVCIF